MNLNLIAQKNSKTNSSEDYQKLAKTLHDSIPSLGSIIIQKDNRTVLENYYGNANSETLFNVKSVTKSVLSLLVGIAKDQNKLPNLDTPLLTVLPEYDVIRGNNPRSSNQDALMAFDSIRKTIQLHHLLTMTSGFLYTENSDLSRAMGNSSDPARFVLDLPFDEYPGDKFNYNSGETHLMGIALSKMVQQSLLSYAKDHLFKPLNIKTNKWNTDLMDRHIGGSELFLTANDMVKIGNLVLNEGVVNGKSIVSKDWIKTSTAQQVELTEWDVLPKANGYGYYWWRRKSNNHQAFVAVGYGGQIICIIPDLKMVVTTTCFLNNTNRGRSELIRIHRFIDQLTK